MITPRELLDTSIAQLRTLVRFLDEQIGEGRGGAEPATAEARACDEILQSLSVLILKLQAAGRESAGNIDLPAVVDRDDDLRLPQATEERLLARISARNCARPSSQAPTSSIRLMSAPRL